MTDKRKIFDHFDKLLRDRNRSENFQASQFDSKYSSRYKQLFNSQKFVNKNKNSWFLKLYAGLISFFAIFVSVVQLNTMAVRSGGEVNTLDIITSEKFITKENPYTFTIFLVESSLDSEVEIKELKKIDKGYELVLSGLKNNSEKQIYIKSLVELDNADQGSVKVVISSDED